MISPPPMSQMSLPGCERRRLTNFPIASLTNSTLRGTPGGGAWCENTMKRAKLEKKDFVELSTTVDSGVSEVIRKQEDGYAYIKSGG